MTTNDPNEGLPPRFLVTRDAARFLGVSMRTMEKHRTYGTGSRVFAARPLTDAEREQL
jgi:hypothetical protein